MFKDHYRLTDPAEHSSNAGLGEVATLPETPRSGTYNGGLVTVVDADMSAKLLAPWNWLIGDTHALLTTGLGDVFFWKTNESAIYFLNVQHRTTEFVDRDLTWFLDQFLEKDGVVEHVLRKPLFDSLVRHHRTLQYHEVFILEPWQMLGGEERVEDFVIGQCAVYLELVGLNSQP